MKCSLFWIGAVIVISIAKDLHLEEVSIFECLHFKRKVCCTHQQKSELVRFCCFPNNILNKIYRIKIPLGAILSTMPILNVEGPFKSLTNRSRSSFYISCNTKMVCQRHRDWLILRASKLIKSFMWKLVSKRLT